MFDDEPEPTEDDMISKCIRSLNILETHYLKHHPFWEFKNFKELEVDPYRYWLHQRAEYYNTETYPGELDPYENGVKASHWMFMGIQVAIFFGIARNFVSNPLFLT